MPRYIDADALLKHEIEADRMGAMLVVGKGYILSAPEVDAVPVVRCKYCKHLIIVNKKPIYAVCAKTGRVFELWQEDTRQHYCSYGAKMEDKP